MPLRAFDSLTVRCPQLGHDITFGYCRVLEDGLPCSRALVCFASRFPVEAFFRAILTGETFVRCFERPRPDRVGRLLSEVEAARKRAGG
ncbi:MAG: hypothetical protein HY907_10110 [Deltaproteobacteria bacterium]|nr:hypothetical protein [Deltaproteobacteria bacterium]